MKKNKVVLTFIALFTFVGGAFALANYTNGNTLYSRSASGVYTPITTWSNTDANGFLATTSTNATYYTYNGTAFSTAVTPGQTIYVVTAQ